MDDGALARRLSLALSYSTHLALQSTRDAVATDAAALTDGPHAPLFPLDLARACRDVCVCAGRCAAHGHSGNEDGNVRELAMMQQHLSALAQASPGTSLAEDIRQLSNAASAHEVASFANKEPPDNALQASVVASVRSLEESLGKDVAGLIAEMASAAGRYAAGLILGPQGERGHGDEALVVLLRAFHRLSTWRRAKWVGVNLGGWLLLEYGPSTPLFQNQGAEYNGEWSFAEMLRGKGIAEEVFAEHRARHVTADELRRIAAAGLNAIRVPFG